MIRQSLRRSSFIVFIVSLFFAWWVFGGSVFASETDGSIDSTNRYAWSENIGWVDFGTTEGNVHVADSALTGYAWAENAGWISLNCSNTNFCATVDYKVANDSEGTLSGHAWGENVGWIAFNPSGGGVTIDASGNFAGYAWGENTGWIVFNCSTTNSCSGVNYNVSTDWKPASTRSSGGGGGFFSVAFHPPTKPEGGFRVIINNGATYTESRDVVLTLTAGKDTERMAVANNAGLAPPTTGQIALSDSYSWDICYFMSECPDGEYTVYVKFFTQYGQGSELIFDSIILRKSQETPEISEKEQLISQQPQERLPLAFEPTSPIPTPLFPDEKIIPPETPPVSQEPPLLVPEHEAESQNFIMRAGVTVVVIFQAVFQFFKEMFLGIWRGFFSFLP